MQISAEGVKFYFYTEHVLKSNRKSGLNLSFDENKKINFALRFLKYLAGFTSSQRQKCGYQICFYLLNLQEACHYKIIESMKRIRSLAKKKFFSCAF